MFIIPIEKDNPLQRLPIIVYITIAINVGVFILSKYFLSWEQILNTYGFTPAEATWLSAITAMFLHGGVFHLVGNMFFFWMFADNIEDVLGHYVFIVVYIVCGLGATGLHYLLNSGSLIPCIGASGAISGMVGMYMVFFPHTHIDLAVYLRHMRVAVFHVAALGGVLAWLGEQTVLGIIMSFAKPLNHGGIAFWAHIGGLLSGIALGALLKSAGMKPAAPAKILKIEREKYCEAWCPYCGKEETGRKFGRFECSGCGTRYEIVKSDALRESKRKQKRASDVDGHIKCPECGAVCDGRAKICLSCGKSLRTKNCPNCREILDIRATTCLICGEALENSILMPAV